MKIKSFFAVLTLIVLFSLQQVSGQIKHLEPPFWWAGMNNPNLQLLVHGENIAQSNVEISYDGIRINSVSRVKNPNYIFIDLQGDWVYLIN